VTAHAIATQCNHRIFHHTRKVGLDEKPLLVVSDEGPVSGHCSVLVHPAFFTHNISLQGVVTTDSQKVAGDAACALCKQRCVMVEKQKSIQKDLLLGLQLVHMGDVLDVLLVV
jgi:hypothetical protein